jgi:hypothetical protein
MTLDCYEFYLWTIGALDIPRKQSLTLKSYLKKGTEYGDDSILRRSRS